MIHTNSQGAIRPKHPAYLPSEVVQQIFGYVSSLHTLQSIARVNKEWNSITLEMLSNLKNQPWMKAFIEYSLAQQSWAQIDWKKPFSKWC